MDVGVSNQTISSNEENTTRKMGSTSQYLDVASEFGVVEQI